MAKPAETPSLSMREQGLEHRIRARISQEGPLRLDEYMSMCLYDPGAGYYARRQPLGAEGDFITAPEVSQVFGELIGLWAASVWLQMGSPRKVMLIELGPGRGSLAADALRAAKALPAFANAINLHLVEISAPLRALQARALQAFHPVRWHKRLETVPDGPAIIIGNEFLDALPIRQIVWRESGWRERCVGMGAEGRFVFTTAAPAVLSREDRGILPTQPIEGMLRELRPGIRPLLTELARRAGNAPLAALFVDYGYTRGEAGDTFQAVSRHRYGDPLQHPGEQDLTAHVDFAAFLGAAKAAGLSAWGPMPQGQFLLRLGLETRCRQLMRNAEALQQNTIMSGVRRLIDPRHMGELFKAVAVTSAELDAPPPFADQPA